MDFLAELLISNLEIITDEFETQTGIVPSHKLSFYSNLFMLIPAMFTVVKGMKFFTVVILYTMMCSMIYHYRECHKTFCLDATGIVLISGTMMYLTKYNKDRFSLLCMPTYFYLVFGLGFWVIATVNKTEGKMDLYDIYHGCWHILVAFAMINFFYAYYYRNLYIGT